ncbi:MAG: pseudouridine synthase [Candidatus Margulisbacteria bacterium]|nr:pseudouridine synthase [Candidatus Margulisiibacteriota bacterium]
MKSTFRYIIFNKPYGVLCQFTDPQGHPTLKDYIDIPGVYSVGRLDYDSEGLLFLTDDSRLNHLLSEPKFKQPKTYWAQVEGKPDRTALIKLEKGVTIAGRQTLPAKVRLLPDEPKVWARTKPIRFRKNVPTAWLEIVICEGMNRQVRKMTAAVGHPCLRLVRVAIGPLKLGGLKPGEYAFIDKPRLN